MYNLIERLQVEIILAVSFFYCLIFNILSFIARGVTLYASSDYKGGRQSATDPTTGKLGRGGRYITREQRRADLRAAFGIKG